MKKITYLLFIVSLLGCQENAPKNKPVQIAQYDTIMENHDSAIVAKPNIVLNSKTDTTTKPIQPTKPQKPPKKKASQKAVTIKKQNFGNDLIIENPTFFYCQNAKTFGYYFFVYSKHQNITILYIHFKDEKHFVGRTDYEKAINVLEANGRRIGFGVPTKDTSISPTGNILIEYQLDKKTKYQSVPINIFKKSANLTSERPC